MSVTARTLSEIEAAGRKAARGAGCPWGLAEEAGRGARLLSEHGLDGAGVLARLLTGARACRCTGDRAAPACAIALLARVQDALSAGSAPDLPGRIAGADLLIAAGISLARRTGSGVVIETGGRIARCGPAGLALARSDAPPGAAFDRVPDRVTHRPDPASRPVADSDWAALDVFARETLVPESAQSRDGAGPDGAETD